MASILLQIGIMYFLGHVFAYSFKRFRIPDILLFTIIGLILGPILHIAKPEDFGQAGPVLSSLALIVILFESGTTLDFSKFAQSAGMGTFITILTMILTLGIAFMILLPMMPSWQMAFLTGIIVSGTSSAVVIPMINSLGVGEKYKNILLLESSLTDVLCIVLTLTISRTLLSGGFQIQTFLEKILLSLIVALAIGLAAGVFWAKFKSYLDANFATIAMALVVYGVTELLGYSGPIAVMGMGVMLAQSYKWFKAKEVSPLTEFESRFYSELVFIFKVFFFVFLGISIKISGPGLLISSAVIILLALTTRFILIRFLKKSEDSVQDLTYTSLLIPKGLAAAVLAGVPGQMGWMQADKIQNAVYAIVIVSIILASIFIPLSGLPKSSKLLSRFFGQ